MSEVELIPESSSSSNTQYLEEILCSRVRWFPMLLGFIVGLAIVTVMYYLK